MLPALAAATVGVSKFLTAFQEAPTAAAKFHVVIDAAKNIGIQLFNAVKNAVAGIDWGGIWAQAKGLAEGLERALAAVNWAHVGDTIGSSIARAVEGVEQ